LTEVSQKTSHGMLQNSVMKDYTDIFSENKNQIVVNTSKGIHFGYPYFYFLGERIWVKEKKEMM
jgi:hypothetical protein